MIDTLCFFVKVIFHLIVETNHHSILMNRSLLAAGILNTVVVMLAVGICHRCEKWQGDCRQVSGRAKHDISPIPFLLPFPSITTTFHQYQHQRKKTCLEVEPKTLAVNLFHCLSLNLPCCHYWLLLYENLWDTIILAYPDTNLLGDSALFWMASLSLSFCLNSFRYCWYSYGETYIAC